MLLVVAGPLVMAREKLVMIGVDCPGTASGVVKIDVTDAANGITITNNKITVREAEIYLVVAAPQVGCEGAGPLGCFDLWCVSMRKMSLTPMCNCVRMLAAWPRTSLYIAGHNPAGGG